MGRLRLADVDAERVADGAKHGRVARSALGRHAAAPQHDDAVAAPQREVEVVDHRNDRGAAPLPPHG